MPEKLNPEGSFGAPPAGAPRETTQPLHHETFADQLARARSNERELKPFAPVAVPIISTDPPQRPDSLYGIPDDGLAITTRPDYGGQPRSESPSRVETMIEEMNEITRIEVNRDVARDPVPPPIKPRPIEPILNYQPAASDTDSPSRGMPKPILDPGKRITGGFGDSIEAQYFPLDGQELKELVLHLMDELAARIENDLRFHVAITYPRVAARVVIEVEGYAENGNFQIVKHLLPNGTHDKTPVEIARTKGDEVCFVVTALRQEFSADGDPENPPDRVRDELGLEKPRKQQVQAGASRIMVDRVTNLDGSF